MSTGGRARSAPLVAPWRLGPAEQRLHLGEQGYCASRADAPNGTVEGGLKPFVAERLQQVVHGVRLEGAYGEGVVGRHEDHRGHLDEGPSRRLARAARGGRGPRQLGGVQRRGGPSRPRPGRARPPSALSPYPPTSTSIQQAWSKLKARLRAEGARSREALDVALGPWRWPRSPPRMPEAGSASPATPLQPTETQTALGEPRRTCRIRSSAGTSR